MTKGRLEAFTDGVLAIVITIMVLEFKIPEGGLFKDLLPLWPKFLSYVLSFIYLAIYWNNHHHMLQTVKKVNGRMLWANMHLLFWLSLIPFTTAWMGENEFTESAVGLYGIVLLGSAIAYWILQKTIINYHGSQSLLANALGNDLKGKLSPVLYALAIIISFFAPWISGIIYVLVAIMWLVPDRRIEKAIRATEH